ncbi:MAG TPA: hypothetical protein VIJ82_27135 [Streptosporangiaceae bacterium]|jgi:uridine kinase
MEPASLIAAAVQKLSRTRDRVLVGIDGSDGAGKTTLADQLASDLAPPALR